jgi:hypothetical protein
VEREVFWVGIIRMLAIVRIDKRNGKIIWTETGGPVWGEIISPLYIAFKILVSIGNHSQILMRESPNWE